jgi:hypothetical protein
MKSTELKIYERFDLLRKKFNLEPADRIQVVNDAGCGPA